MGVLDEDWWRKLQLGEGIAPMDDVVGPTQGILSNMRKNLHDEFQTFPKQMQDVARGLNRPLDSTFVEDLGTTPTAKKFKSGATLPGDVYSGKQPMGLPSKTEDLTRVADLMSMMGTGAFAPKKSAAGIFGGRLSQTADQAALKEAMRMEKGAKKPADIWQDTGWGRGIDKEWRYEIPDDKAALRNFNPAKEMYGEGRLEDVLIHPELYAAHPDMAKIPVEVERAPFAGGGYNPKIGKEVESIGAYGPNSKAILSELLHESMHGVQTRNNFTPGGNPDLLRYHPEAPNLVDKYANTYKKLKMSEHDAYSRAEEQALLDLYRRLAGEVEPRNVQTRQDWLPAKRRRNTPESSEDIPRRDQILLGRF